jgi:hypothetical membrane protein
MDASIAILGLSMILGSVLIFSEFSFSKEPRERIVAIAGFTCMALGGLGAIIVGIRPENHNEAHLHAVGTALAIGFGQAAILILGLVLRQIPDWLRQFMLVTSLFVLLAGVSIAFKHSFGFGGGALERLAQYPESLWLILFGFYVSRDHLRNGKIRSKFKFSDATYAPNGSTIPWAWKESLNPRESVQLRLPAPRTPSQPKASVPPDGRP